MDRLMPGDQILNINGEDVARAPRDHVIQLVRNCRERVSLVVCQPPLDNVSTRVSHLSSVLSFTGDNSIETTIKKKTIQSRLPHCA